MGHNTFTLALTPHGTLHLETQPTETTGGTWDSAALAEAVKAFRRGSGDGLFELAARHPHAHLPPVFARWRDFARLFLVDVTLLPEEADAAALPTLPFPEEAAAEWLKGAPLMPGAEYLSIEVLRSLWRELNSVFQHERSRGQGNLQAFLQRLHPLWNQVGRVHLHLAENKNSPETPFAFMTTYTSAHAAHALGGRIPHLPLSQALKEYAGARNKPALLSLLRPLQKGSAASVWLKELVDSGDIYHPLAWTPAEAYRFLKEVPALETTGLVIRVPNWWKTARPPRPKVRITVGQKSSLGMDNLLDFQATLTLDGQTLSQEEWDRLLASTENLVQIRGQWVELDGEKLRQALDHWTQVRRAAGQDGIGFLEGMRLLAGAPMERLDAPSPGAESAADWTEVIAGKGLDETLKSLQSPDTLPPLDVIQGFKGELRPYQKDGVQWLRFLNRLGLGACLADDMGLGKTVQVLALLSDLKARGIPGPHLLVLPASLLGNWLAEIDRFAPGLKTLAAHPSVLSSRDLEKAPAGGLKNIDLVLTTYGTLLRTPWLSDTQWGLAILDEAQAIKNPDAKQTRAVKTLKCRQRLALTGTPVENRLSDLWSLYDFLCPGLLGNAAEFARYAKSLGMGESPSYGPLRNLVRPYLLRRLKTDKHIISDLPDKTELKAFCGLSKIQAALYQQSVDALTRQIEEVEGIQRKGVILAFLMRFKQICNHPSQWSGDGKFNPEDSAKFGRLKELVETIAAKQEKVLVFTQFREMTGPLSRYLADIFGRPGLVLHGETPVKDRRALVQSFQDESGPPFFVLSLKAGGTGLNLTAAAHVIHFDRWWNPAVENQATDRAYRIGQKKNVLVHKFVCRGTVEEKIDRLIESKVALSKDLLEGSESALLTRMTNQELLSTVALDLSRALAES
jgi:non-specific serine/threonine protein kinase